MFSTVFWLANLSVTGSAPACASGSAWGIRNSSRCGSARTHRRQLPVRVRYCTKPQVLQRMTSRSISREFIVAFSNCADTGTPRVTLSGVRIDERERRNVLREGRHWRTGSLAYAADFCQEYFCTFLLLSSTLRRPAPRFRLYSSAFSPLLWKSPTACVLFSR